MHIINWDVQGKNAVETHYYKLQQVNTLCYLSNSFITNYPTRIWIHGEHTLYTLVNKVLMLQGYNYVRRYLSMWGKSCHTDQ
jgi:hypothetical protein